RSRRVMKQYRRSGWFTAALAGLALVLGTGTAEAAFTVTLDAGSPTGSGPFTYTYTASIPSGDQINPGDQTNPGDFFRIYDFAGYVAGSIAAPAGWTATTALTNAVPPPSVILTHDDEPTIPNLVFTYTGTAPIVGPTSIGGFTAMSTFPLTGAIKDF